MLYIDILIIYPPECNNGTRTRFNFKLKLIDVVDTQVAIVEFIVIVLRRNQPMFSYKKFQLVSNQKLTLFEIDS